MKTAYGGILKTHSELVSPGESQSATPTAANVEMAVEAGPVDQLEAPRFEKALQAYCSEMRKKFDERFPGIGYDSDTWDFRGTKEVDGKRVSLRLVHNTKMTRICPGLVVSDLASLHSSIGKAARAVLAEQATQDESKLLFDLEHGLRLLKHLQPTAGDANASTRALWTLTLEDLRGIEKCVVNLVKVQGRSAEAQRSRLHALFAAVELLQSRDAVGRLNARISVSVKEELGRQLRKQEEDFKKNKGAELEPSIAALSDAIVAMADDNPALSTVHKAVLCVMGLEMCAPSRINEVMTLSVKDRLATLHAYEETPQIDEASKATSAAAAALKVRRDLHRAHAEIGSEAGLLLTMKGSKGASWGAKPILDFMMSLFNECFDRLIQYGQRSRMLMKHYESRPAALYLPPSLEHLRGMALDRWQIGRVMLLNAEASDYEASIASQHVIGVLTVAGKTFRRKDASEAIIASDHTRTLSRGKDGKARSDMLYVCWGDIEAELLRRVHEQMESTRWVTATIRYEGKLSNMLLLNDWIANTPPFLPGALNGKYISKCLKPAKSGQRQPQKTVFDLLGITMPIQLVEDQGSRDSPAKFKEVVAYVSTHDPRRWLTTQALRLAGPQLSNVVINKWANRKDIGQVDAYDYSTSEEKAERSAAPMPVGVKEFESLSAALGEFSTRAQGLHVDYGLKTRLLTSGTRTVEVTTFKEIRSAVENRPVARAGDKVIILYPTEYGVCLHQHHERPCTAYNGCGSACNEEVFVKGDLPSNEATKQRAQDLRAIIVEQIRPLILAHSREVVHELPSLESHIMGMITLHMNIEAIATRLIEEFHDYKHLIKDAAFRSRLEDAHVFQGVSKLLDSSEISSGALIKYDSLSRHGSPEVERSIDSLGGREGIAKTIATFNTTRPWFEPILADADDLARPKSVDGLAANDEELLTDDDGEVDEA